MTIIIMKWGVWDGGGERFYTPAYRTLVSHEIFWTDYRGWDGHIVLKIGDIIPRLVKIFPC